MAFCTNCGKELPTDANFCSYCGTPARSGHDSKRSTVYDGEVHKCPNCGEVLNSFIPVCPSCGYEKRNAHISNSIREFADSILNAKTESQMIIFIRNFPIPNAKEDIYEYMIIASSNITENIGKEVLDAWNVKIEQGFQKAKFVLKDDPSLAELQILYDKTQKKISRIKANRYAKNVGASINKGSRNFLQKHGHALPHMAICAAWIISVLVLIPLCKGVSGTDYQIFLFFNFIAGSIFIPYATKTSSPLPRLIVVLGLALSIAILIPLCKGYDGVDYQIMLFFDIVATTIISARIFRKAKNVNKNEEQ